MKTLAWIAFVFVACSSMASGVIDTTRICSYNALKYSAANEDGRIPHFATVMNAIRPDILICQEVEDGTLGPRFIADVLTYAPFAATPFIDGPDTDIQLLYDQTRFSLLGQRRIKTALRDIAEFTLLVIPSNGMSADTLVIYGMHLKASDGFETERSKEIDSLLKHMVHKQYVVACGDMNFYAPTEPAYVKLVGASLLDPLGANWRRNSSSHAHFYTQCPRKDQQPSCGGGVDGGMDDRFDFIFLSEELSSKVVPGSYTSFGNDGQARLNSSILDPPNTIVSQQIAEALHCASDHLPVFVDLLIGDVQAGVDPLLAPSFTVSFSGTQIVVTGCMIGSALTVHDMNGRLVKTVSVTDPTMQIDASTLPNGFYIVSQLTATAGVSIVR